MYSGARDRRNGHIASSHYIKGLLWLIISFGTALVFSQNEPPGSATAFAGRDDKELERVWNETKKDSSAWADSILEAQKDLARFGYGTLFTSVLDDKTNEALSSYQRRNSLPVSGTLDFATWRLIERDNFALDLHISIGPPYLFIDSDWNRMFTASGVWLEQGKEPSENSELVATRIECFKQTQMCIVATQQETQIHLEYLGIERWDKQEIVTNPNDLPCGREYVHISRPEKSVLSINTAVYQNVEACMKLFGPPSKPMVSRLADSNLLLNARLKALWASRDRIVVIPKEKKDSHQPASH